MFNARRMLDQLVQGMANPAPSRNTAGVLNNPAITGALSGVGGGLLAGMLLGNRRARRIAPLGGAAALGAIANSAYRNWQAKNNQLSVQQPIQQSLQQPIEQSQQSFLDFDSLPATEQEVHCRVMLAAIIAAAKADGHFDERERQIIREYTEKINDHAELG